jgi:hypothetical protein
VKKRDKIGTTEMAEHAPACATTSTACPTRTGVDSGASDVSNVQRMRGYMARARWYSIKWPLCSSTRLLDHGAWGMEEKNNNNIICILQKTGRKYTLNT